MTKKPGRFGNRRNVGSGGGQRAHKIVGGAVQADRHVVGYRDRGHGMTTCPVCNETVPLRKNGTISSHRVGSGQKNSWPCPGSGPIKGA